MFLSMDTPLGNSSRLARCRVSLWKQKWKSLSCFWLCAIRMLVFVFHGSCICRYLGENQILTGKMFYNYFYIFLMYLFTISWVQIHLISKFCLFAFNYFADQKKFLVAVGIYSKLESKTVCKFFNAYIWFHKWFFGFNSPW